MAKPYLSHLKTAADLETTYEAVRAGFVTLALEKNRRATPYVVQARALKEAASQSSRAIDLLKIRGIQSALVTAAGVSDKAANHLRKADKRKAVMGLIDRTALARIREAFAKHKRKPHKMSSLTRWICSL